MYYKRNIEPRSHSHCCLGKAKVLTYSECLSVALLFLHENLMRPVILSYVAYLALRYFPTLSDKWHHFPLKP